MRSRISTHRDGWAVAVLVSWAVLAALFSPPAQAAAMPIKGGGSDSYRASDRTCHDYKKVVRHKKGKKAARRVDCLDDRHVRWTRSDVRHSPDERGGYRVTRFVTETCVGYALGKCDLIGGPAGYRLWTDGKFRSNGRRAWIGGFHRCHEGTSWIYNVNATGCWRTRLKGGGIAIHQEYKVTAGWGAFSLSQVEDHVTYLHGDGTVSDNGYGGW